MKVRFIKGKHGVYVDSESFKAKCMITSSYKRNITDIPILQAFSAQHGSDMAAQAKSFWSSLR